VPSLRATPGTRERAPYRHLLRECHGSGVLLLDKVRLSLLKRNSGQMELQGMALFPEKAL
jgi:hypothetical protein